jgi:hypothetical protein
MCEVELSRRGLRFMDVGHGWTVESFGLSTASGWEPDSSAEISENVREYLAEVDGKREFFKGVPMNTNMCMSSPGGRALFANAVADYVESHTNVDIISIALADNHHNHCECAECRKKTPSDWFVVMLNDIDDELTRRSLSSRVVFPAYYETMWPPVSERIKNEDRFILMFCPLNRDYKSSFDGVPEDARVREFRLNDPAMKIPSEIDEFSLFLREWQKVYGGACFAFGGFMLLLEFLLHIAFGLPGIGTWSPYPLIVFALLGATLIIFAICPKFREPLERKFFL